MLLSFLLGFFCALLWFAWLVYRFLLVDPGLSETEHLWRLDFFRRQKAIQEEDEAQHSPRGQVAFLNKMAALYFAELTSSDAFKTAILRKVSSLMSSTFSPPTVSLASWRRCSTRTARRCSTPSAWSAATWARTCCA